MIELEPKSSVVGRGNPGAVLSKMNQEHSFDVVVVAAAAEGMSMAPFHEQKKRTQDLA
jgi:hypothetical protein